MKTAIVGVIVACALGCSLPLYGGDRPRDAAEALYQLGDVDQAQALANRQLKQGKSAFEAHEVLCWVADLRGDTEGAFRHGLTSALDPESDALRYHLTRLAALHSGPDEWKELVVKLEELASRTSDAGGASLALHMALEYAWRLGDFESHKRLLGKLGHISAWQVVAGFENDRKKGFDAVYGPEEGTPDLSARYVGQKHEIGWREVSGLDEGGRVPLGDLQSPDEWSVAYLATWVRSSRRADVVLEVTSSDPVKVWSNGIAVLQAREVEGHLAGHLAARIRLFEGWNIILVKSCQESGSWFLGARLVEPAGRPVEGLRYSAQSQPHVVPAGAGSGWTFEHSVLARYSKVRGTSRRDFIKGYMSYKEGFVKEASKRLEEFLSRYPESAPALLMASFVAWSQDEDERMLGHFDAAISRFPRLAEFPFHRASYFRSKKRHDRALEDIDRALGAAPDYAAARLLQARLYENKGWQEEACNVYRLLHGFERKWAELVRELAGCELDGDRLVEAVRWYEEILSWWPTNTSALGALGQLYEVGNRNADARQVYLKWAQMYPYKSAALLRLAGLHRAERDWVKAEEYLEQVTRLSPDLALPHKKAGEMAMERDLLAEARRYWKRALQLNPEDYGLWERMERLEPADAALLTRFVPTDEAVESAIRTASSSEVPQEASYVYLLDHEVTQLHMDGSVRRIVTQVIGIKDEIGRDMFSSYGLPRGGYVRMKKAYVLGPDGQRKEVSSLREHTIRFQDLTPGSVVVLQYRHDTHGETFLNNHWHKEWNFQSSTGYTGFAQWVVVVPDERPLRRHVRGDISEKVGAVEGQTVYEWTAEKLPPLKVQPVSPPIRDLAARVSVSTIPDWDFFARWEWAMVKEAIRLTAELTVTAQDLTKNARSAEEKVNAIYDYVANKIRYVQDYESVIAKMRPHAASTTFERKYGDCKDVSVLMVTLLKAVGVEARYAGISTRRRGKMERSVPAQQFDHAIVYIPAQEGIQAARFCDATAEHLDMGNLPKLIQGQTAMIVSDGGHEFIPVSFSPPDHELVDISVAVYPAGLEEDARVEVTMTLRGEMAAQFRKTHTNPERFRQGMEGLLCGLLYPGGRLTQLNLAHADTIGQPVVLSATILAPNVLTRQGDGLAMTVLYPFNLAGAYAKWKERRFPLDYGAPTLNRVSMDIHLPEGLEPILVPKDSSVVSPCVDFRLESHRQSPSLLNVQYTLKRTCTQVAPEQYQAHRKSLLEVSRILAEKIRLKESEK